ncbi:MAG: response regulator [Steroidobacteraceae bacterium]
MNYPVRVLIVDDHPLVREGLIARISAQPDLEVCGEASDVDQALSLVGITRPALMIVDLALKGGNGLDLIKKVKARDVSPKILVVSAYEEEIFAERALRAGAQGYINKQELQGSIIDAIRTLLRGELYLSANMTQRLAGQALFGSGVSRGGIEGLSDRELQIFQLIGRGNSTRLIAEQLHLSVHTIESHREKIRIKLRLRGGTELLQRAVQWVLEKSP